MKIKRTLSLFLTACLVLALVPAAAFAAAPHCDKAVDDCIVCKVAAMINNLPDSDEVTINNAAAVTEQIHAIDRIKVELSDDEYLELLTLVEEGTNEQGQGLGIPKKYFDTLDALAKVGGGGSLYVSKKFVALDGSVNVADAEVKLELTNVATNAQQILTLSTLSTRTDTLSGVPGFYSEVDGGWQYKYLLPAGTYIIKEISDSGAKVNGSDFVTGSVTYTLNGQPLEEGAEIEIEDGGEYSVVVMNTYKAYPVTVNNGTYSCDNVDINGNCIAGNAVTITAYPAPAGQKFKDWEGAEGLTFTAGDATTSTATFTMPDNAVTLTATYEADSTGGTDEDSTTKPARKDIKITYNGGNSFSTNKSEVPTSVEIDGVPVSFTGNGRNFTVSSIPAGADRITVRWNSTSASINFKPDAVAYSFNVELPKTGDVSILGYAVLALTAVAGALGFKK